MREIKLKQLKYECDAWKRMLGFLTDENIYLKNRLSDILKANIDKNLLEEIEIFHNRFIREDELIGLLRNDIAKVDDLFLRETLEKGKLANEIEKNLQKIRNNISHAEKQFGSLKKDFAGYLSEIYSR